MFKKHHQKINLFLKLFTFILIFHFLSFSLLNLFNLPVAHSATLKIEKNLKTAQYYYNEKKKIEEKNKELKEEKEQLEKKNKRLEEEIKKLENDTIEKEQNEKKAYERNAVIEEAQKKLIQDKDLLIEPIGLEEVTIAKFIDGDTTRFYYHGEDTSFRYLLIDTPETKHPRVGVQPFGPEASDRTEELLSNANTIEVEHDIGERTDLYGRHLAYIWVDGVMVNEVLAREGLAEVTFIYPPNTRHLDRLKEAERLAKEEEIGIWSLPSSFEDSDEESDSNDSETTDDSNRENPEVIPDAPTSFQNCNELREWYPNGVGSDHPAYSPKLDGDKDGWACETN